MLQLFLVCLIINLPSAFCQFFVQAAIGGATATGQGANPAANLQQVTPPSAMADANIAAFLAGDRTNSAFNRINSNSPIAQPTAQGMTSSDGFTAFTSAGSGMGTRPGYGNRYGYDYGSDIPNAGIGGYPARGGFSGYWEPGVHPVPLALQGWGLFMPRPPVEITTPTTTATTRPPTTATPTTRPSTTTRPNVTTVVTLPTTAAPIATTVPTTPLRTTTLTFGTSTTVLPYAINNPSYNFNRMKISADPAAKLATLPEILIFNGQKVRVTPLENDKDFQAIFGNTKAAFPNLQLSDSLQNPVPELTVSNPDMFELPSTCVPVTMPSTTGQCVPNALLQIACW